MKKLRPDETFPPRRRKKEAASEETASFLYYGSPNGIRTRVLTLRGLRPRPLVDGALLAGWGTWIRTKIT